MHVQSIATLGTPEVRDLTKEQFTKLKPGEALDLDTFFGEGPEKMQPMYAGNLFEWRAGNFISPYLELRRMVLSALAPVDRLKLAQEIEAVDLSRNFEPKQHSVKELAEAYQTMDRPGNMLDQLDAVVPSIPRRFTALTRIGIE